MIIYSKYIVCSIREGFILNKICQSSYNYQPTNSTKKTTKISNDNNNKSFNEVLESTNKNKETINKSDIWRKVAQKHDITNCTYGEFRDAIKELKETGAISGTEYLQTGLDLREVEKRIGRKINCVMFSRNNCNGKVNWLNEFKVRLDRKGNNDKYKVNSVETTLNILECLNSSRN